MDNKGYYKILGVNENATKEEIDKAFKKCAIKYHPDKWVNGTDAEKKEAEENFKKVNEAHSILGDEQKRAQYDRGFDDTNMGGGFSPFEDGFNPFDIFNHMRNGGQRVNKGEDLQATATISIQEAFNGGQVKISIARKKKCNECNGTGNADGKESTCPHCHGTGFITQTTQRGNMIMQQTSPCPHCHGTGKVVTNPCKKCHGEGTINEYTTEYVDVPKGIADGMTFVIKGKGNAPVGNGINGDLYVTVNVLKDNYFERPDSINLIHTEEIPFNEGLLGFEKEFKNIDGKTFKLKVPECTPDGYMFIRKGEGMPDVNNPYHRGDYAIVIKYKYPNKLTKEQREKLNNF